MTSVCVLLLQTLELFQTKNSMSSHSFRFCEWHCSINKQLTSAKIWSRYVKKVTKQEAVSNCAAMHIAKWIGLFQEKIQTGVEGILSQNPCVIFIFFYFTPWNSRKNEALPLEIPQNCVRSLGNSTCYFFDTPGENSVSSTLLLPLFGFFLIAHFPYGEYILHSSKKFLKFA